MRLGNLFTCPSITHLIGRYQPPWDENWDLDDKFFTQMEEWEKDHPESTFAKVMENVNSAVSTCRPFLECIPDSPFPARSVILGLANLLQLGTVRILIFLYIFSRYSQLYMKEIASAKKAVYDFTMQVSTWFYTVEASFRMTKKKKFTAQARKNLDAIRCVLWCNLRFLGY